jgi:hypothetical protein
VGYNWTASADQLLDTRWGDDERISRLEHELRVNDNPCSWDRCLKCNPDLPQRQIQYDPGKDAYNVRTIVGDYATTSTILRQVFDQQILYIQAAKFKEKSDY